MIAFIFQPGCSLLIFFHIARFIVLPAIYLNYNLFFKTYEINNVFANRVLSAEF
jgi:hypothetical protein